MSTLSHAHQLFRACLHILSFKLHWRTRDEQPPSALRMASPYDPEARDSRKRDTPWVGHKLHLTDTCDPGQPDLITQVLTTPATTPDCVMGPTVHHDPTQRDLLPGTHLLDSGPVDADLLVTAQTMHQIDVVGPPFGSYSRQRRAGEGYDLQAFVIDGDAQQARCPQDHTSVHWRPGQDVSGDPVIRIRFDGATCRTCPTRQACTSVRGAPRHLTVRLQTHHEALQTARQRQETPEFTAQYALQVGVESSLSQGVRRFDLGQSRYLGFARTHLQQLLTATAVNVVRVIAWLWASLQASAGGSPATLPNFHPILCHARRCSANDGGLTQQSHDLLGHRHFW